MGSVVVLEPGLVHDPLPCRGTDLLALSHDVTREHEEQTTELLDERHGLSLLVPAHCVANPACKVIEFRQEFRQRTYFQALGRRRRAFLRHGR